ncbi:MAG: MinD/ParA family protein [Alphaproteobacteria bacterium]|nr:MinD/ParA family protein [Alphaproteobacteria bacterium]
MSVVTSIAQTAARAQARNLLAVASGKGGVGKTWLSVTLSHALAQRGQRVLLFDGDLGLANVDIQLGLTPAKDLGTVMAGQSGLREAITQFEEGGFDILAGKSGSGALATLSPQRLAELRDQMLQIARGYDLVVADLGAGIESAVRTIAGAAGTLLVVATDEPTSLTDAYALIKVMNGTTPGADIRVVINQAANPSEGEKTYKTLLRACTNFLKITPPLAGIVRRDDRVKDSIRHQMPILTRHPGSNAASDVATLAGSLAKAP